ncbi:hypothetical protein HPB51_021667 [Rhipicephalus microplus]|uniref:Transposable element P transposase-like RNase H C-terminal domain-containing protein n=1 Tax=Rhipicephalus microplus TaxID=6941 RepID=A0A9J6E4F8_RHIMP|nr:hypothetical protein HPB51_021667 [Rhipicephalus microplus]
MTARCTAEAFRPNSASEESIKGILSFRDAWERHADKKFLSESSAEGLRVTLTSTLELLRYLRGKYGFRYLLTSRLSQDKVENFFGIVRLSSGCNSHPTPQQFLLTVHCRSFYDLVHSVEDGNAEGDVSSLLDVGDRDETPKQQLIDQMKLCAEKQAGPSGSCKSEAVEHEHHIQRSDSRLIYYISGYVARKCGLPTKCSACNDSLLPTEEGRRLHVAEFVRHNDQDWDDTRPNANPILLDVQLFITPCSRGSQIRSRNLHKTFCRHTTGARFIIFPSILSHPKSAQYRNTNIIPGGMVNGRSSLCLLIANEKGLT